MSFKSKLCGLLYMQLAVTGQHASSDDVLKTFRNEQLQQKAPHNINTSRRSASGKMSLITVRRKVPAFKHAILFRRTKPLLMFAPEMIARRPKR